MKQCFEGWKQEDGNTGGRCCCNCEYQRPITGHPWNKIIDHITPISQVIAWGCTVQFPNINLFEVEHSMCEMWTPRTWDN